MTSSFQYLSDHTKGAELHEIAVKVIEATLDYGQSRHPEGLWLRTPVHEHVKHAAMHLRAWATEVTPDEPHLQHALTRLAMALLLSQ